MLTIRPDLVDAQARAWRQLTSPGASWSGDERTAIALWALAALDDPDPLPPWVAPSSSDRDLSAAGALPDAVVDAVYRIARHAATLTEDFYASTIARGVDPHAYVEIVGMIAAVAAVDGFHRAIGRPVPPLPPTAAGDANGNHPVVEAASLNWVPVQPPADRDAAVVQGLSAAPAERDNVMRLAAAQYIPFDEMVDLGWTRGTLSRGEMELIASKLSAARECFY